MRIPFKDIVFVLIQFGLFLAFFLEVETLQIEFPEYIFWLGIAVLLFGALLTTTAVLQLNVHLSPFPSPLPGSKLIQNGAYKFARHPIYTGILLSFLGYGLIVDSVYKLLIVTALFLLFYFKTIYEEKKLDNFFPEYSEYKKRTGRFFPRLF